MRSMADDSRGSKRPRTDSGALSKLANFHPVIVEGMGWYDPRDPEMVASTVVASIRSHLKKFPPSKPLLVIIQGDPLAERGISAITPKVAESLSDSKRGLICLDPSIDPSHTRDADRNGVVVEARYSELVEVLVSKGITTKSGNSTKNLFEALDASVDDHISEQNKGRAAAGKPPVKDYFKTYALLQEVTKAGLRAVCGDSITVAHTSNEINPFSVTSFYKVGLELGLYDANEVVAYQEPSSRTEERAPQDFSAIDPR